MDLLQLRVAIEQGSYQVDPEAIAESILPWLALPGAFEEGRGCVTDLEAPLLDRSRTNTQRSFENDGSRPADG